MTFQRPLRVTSGGNYYNDGIANEERFVRTTNKWRNPRVNHPTVFLFVAPPAAASIAARSIEGGVDGLADMLFFISLFMLCLIAANPGLQQQRLPFKLDSWVSVF